MNRQLSEIIRQRALYRCEYCLLPEAAFPLPFQIDHVVAEKHGGQTVESNLALACAHCNAHKGPNIAGFDEVTKQVVQLFHPRMDIWEEHFRISGAVIQGRTAVGRVTVAVLAMNDADRLLIRTALMREAES